MKIGAAKLKITPLDVTKEEPWGYGFYLGNKFTGVNDDLYASAVEFYDNGKRCLVVSCDVGNLGDSIVKEISEELMEEDYEQINLCATHTHSAPAAVDMRGIGEIHESYTKFLKSQIKQVASDARKNLKEADMFSAISKAEVNLNRALEGGETNNNVYMLFAESELQKTIIYNYAAHPVNVPKENSLISAGFPGYANERFIKDGYMPMFLQGSCGDVNIADPQIFEEAKTHGYTIADKILSAERTKIENPQMELSSIAIDMPIIVPTEKFIEETLEQLTMGQNAGFDKMVNGWKRDTLEDIKNKSYNDTLQIDVNFLHIDDENCLVFHPFELFTSLDNDIRKNCSHNTFLNGYTNNALGYLLDMSGNSSERAKKYSSTIVPMITKSSHLKETASKVFVDSIAEYFEER